MTIFARPSEWTRPGSEQSQPAPHPRSQRYFAFLSYSHRDEPTARWLHESLEKFLVPRHLVGRLTEHGPIPRRLTPIFRDIRELPASDDLGSEIRAALAGSRFLVVLCSREAARSKWTNAEIEAFKRARPEGCVLAAILDGEPFASEMGGREAEECLPAALRFHYDRRGRRTTRRAEPLAADLREPGEARRIGFLKLVAGMLGLGLDELVQRDTLRRQKRMAAITAGSVVGMLVAAGLAFTAIQARDAARDQRREAESLVGFMLGDLREKLEPLGRLDVLDSVGVRALEYYEQQDKGSLSDDSLRQRSMALTLMGEIASVRGDLDGALRHYREAMAGTAEALRRSPNDPQRLFDHAQNVFWIGDIAHSRGDNAEAEAAMRGYKRLADRMVELEPGNRKWLLEVKYANGNLGVILYKQRRFAEASQVLENAVETAEGLLAAEPDNGDYRHTLGESLAWLSDSKFAEGRIDEAIAKRERQIALWEQAIRSSGEEPELQERAIPARRTLGRLLANKGALEAGVEHARAAVEYADKLIPRDPSNARWLEYSAGAKLELADMLLAAGEASEAATHARAGCDQIERLINRDDTVANWFLIKHDCLTQRTRIALDRGSMGEAIVLAEQTLTFARSIPVGDPLQNKLAVADSFRLLGEVHMATGSRQAASRAWQAGLAAWPRGLRQSPRDMAIHADLLRHTGQEAEARALSERLAAIGYRLML